MMMPERRCAPSPGRQVKSGNGVERDVHAKGRRRAAIGLDALPEVAVERRGIDQLQVEELRD